MTRELFIYIICIKKVTVLGGRILSLFRIRYNSTKGKHISYYSKEKILPRTEFIPEFLALLQCLLAAIMPKQIDQPILKLIPYQIGKSSELIY